MTCLCNFNIHGRLNGLASVINCELIRVAAFQGGIQGDLSVNHAFRRLRHNRHTACMGTIDDDIDRARPLKLGNINANLGKVSRNCVVAAAEGAWPAVSGTIEAVNEAGDVVASLLGRL